MAAAPVQDLRGLAALAQSKGPDLRATLLRLQTRGFVDAPSRNRHLAAAYEALALGLIPLVSDTVLDEIRDALAGVPDAPLRVLEALRSSGRIEAASADADLERARDLGVTLDGHALREMVARARTDRPLAAALLARSEPSALDRAALYLFADDESRDAIRRGLETRAAVNAGAQPALDAKSRTLMLAIARSGSLGGLAVAMGLALRIPPMRRLSFAEPAQAELLALCLVAVGLEIGDCVRILLTVDAELARSVHRVFHLSAICRRTSRGAATALVRAALMEGDAAHACGQVAGAAGRQGRARRTAREALLTGSGAPDRRTSGPADHRATATTGRDRT